MNELNTNLQAIECHLKEIEQSTLLAFKALEECKEYDNGSVPTIPDATPNLLNLKAYEARISATLFNGRINDTQRRCILMFSLAYTIYNMNGRHVHMEYLAYALATVYHETGTSMKALEEVGKGEGREYGKPHPETGQIYYGRGFPQLTWYDNYSRASDIVYNVDLERGVIDFLNHPDQALNPFYSAQIIISGMKDGWFTGKKLTDYWLNDDTYDYVNARRIINGTDRAKTIAGYAVEFEQAITLALGYDIERMTVRDGSRGGDVRELQLALGLNPDGTFGPKTEDALINFQQQYKLTADGVCGQATWTSINVEIYGL